MQLRGYQEEAVGSVASSLTDGGTRGQVHAACGTGKTLVALHGARRLLGDDGLVVVVCPSLALVAQVLAVWANEQAPDRMLAVCSDEGVGDSLARVGDLGCAVSCDQGEVAAWLRAHRRGRRLVVATHRSAPVLGGSMLQSRTPADLLIVDEAHRTAGRAGKHSGILHGDDTFPTARRLYMTATPRYLAAGIRSRSGDAPLVSMDDESVFGPVLYSYPFGRAIADGWLDDYQVAVIGVRAADVLRTLQEADPSAVLGIGDTPLRMAVVHTALARAAREWDLRRVIAFTPRVNAAKDFATNLPRTLRLLGDDGPKRPLTADWVAGAMSIRQREIRMEWLREPPDEGWTVLANARCLGEGVDVPAVDGIVFAHPKTSTVDTIQAVGRALRRNPDGSGVSTIIVPVLLPDEPDPALDVDGEWRVLWRVVRALRAHDEVLGAELDAQVRIASEWSQREGLPGRILMRLPDGYDTEHYLRHVTVRLVERTTSSWAVMYGHARDYYAQHGHLQVSERYRTPNGAWLGTWIRRMRADRDQLNDDQRAALNEIGMSWDPPRLEMFDAGLEACQRYVAENGNLLVPQRYTDGNGFRLGTWINSRRREYREGSLAPDRVVTLEQLGMVWSTSSLQWDVGLDACRRYAEKHGDLMVSEDHIDPSGFPLGVWIGSRRREYRDGVLTPDRLETLERLGMVWSVPHARWLAGLGACRRYLAEHGNLLVPAAYVDDQGFRLGKWITKRRTDYNRDALPPAKIQELEQLGMVWRVRANRST